ncbi:ribonuclease T2 [Rhizodiscina lignyota]|uniref:ribonuclease T2 n=1 Tax=Rhizodiscina lignyota TaxID=1504668 RepID=A0A9P4I6A8_9PEZI|nr:ribonuclease T2 [Rhizodiscina lignyota]
MACGIPSINKLARLAFGGAQVILNNNPTVSGGSLQACSNPQLSCQNTTTVENLCCFNHPGGQLLLTQFWDTHPPTGPEDSWTIHGLWPDHCDGTFDASCDHRRNHRNITQILRAFGKHELLTDMHMYWKDWKGNDEYLWQHEFSKHGTCISTLNPECYDEYEPTQEVPEFFQRAVDLFKDLPTYQWLAEAGIEPSWTKRYTVHEIQAALSKHRNGSTVTLGCRRGALDEIWYHFNVRGSAQYGQYLASDPDGMKSRCPDFGIKYLPKSTGRVVGSTKRR